MGWPSVEWGLKHISSLELSEWLAFASVEPIGERRRDYHSAQMAAAIYEAHRDRKRRLQPYGPGDLLYDWWHDKPAPGRAVEEMSLDEQRGQLKMWAAAFGGVFSDGNTETTARPD